MEFVFWLLFFVGWVVCVIHLGLEFLDVLLTPFRRVPHGSLGLDVEGTIASNKNDTIEAKEPRRMEIKLRRDVRRGGRDEPHETINRFRHRKMNNQASEDEGKKEKGE